MRLLKGTRPNVDIAMMKKATLVDEWTRMMSPALDDQVKRLPMPFIAAHRIAVGSRKLVWHSANESHFKSPARQDVDQRHLLGNAYRIPPVRNRVAKDKEPRAFRQARQRSHHHRCRWIDARRGLVMLVEHQIKAFALRDQPLIEISIIQ